MVYVVDIRSDRSSEAGPLENRKSLLGRLLRFMACHNHPQSKDTAGELLWAVCGRDGELFVSYYQVANGSVDVVC